MIAVGRNIVIEKKKEDTIKKTDGGLMLTGKQRVDVRYKEVTVLHCGSDVKGIEEGQTTFPKHLSLIHISEPTRPY